MKKILLLILSLVPICSAQTDPRIMENRYEPVDSLSVIENIFVAAYDFGNRGYIESMVLDEAVPGSGPKTDRLVGILPPHFNTRIKVFGITQENDGLSVTKNERPNAFSHLPKGVEAVAIIKYSYYVKSVDGEQWLTLSRFPVVKKEGKLYIGQFNDAL